MAYLWIKVVHIVFVTSWFAGLFYLPRIYVNLAAAKDKNVYAILLGMAQRLLRFTNILAPIAVLTGLYLAFNLGFSHGWLHAKICLVCLVLIYHYYCYRYYRLFVEKANKHGHRFYRIFNEFPVLLLFLIIALVILKPF